MVLIAIALLAERLFLRLYPPESPGTPDGAAGAAAGANRKVPGLRPQSDPADTVTSSFLTALRALLLKISLPMLGISLPTVLDDTIPPIQYYHVRGSSSLTMCVFVLRKGATLPIHSHPNMTVFSRVVHGDLHVRTFELDDRDDEDDHKHQAGAVPEVDGKEELQSSFRTGRFVRDVIVSNSASTSDSSSIIEINSSTPNLHSFTAASDYVVIFDLLFPPYDEDARVCTYYEPTTAATSLTSTATPSPTPSPSISAVDAKFPNEELAAPPSSGGDETSCNKQLVGENPNPVIEVTQTVFSHLTIAPAITPNSTVASTKSASYNSTLPPSLSLSLTDSSPESTLFLSPPAQQKTATGGADVDASANARGPADSGETATATASTPAIGPGSTLRLVELDYASEIANVQYTGQQVRQEQLDRGQALSDSDLVQLAFKVCVMVDRMGGTAPHPAAAASASAQRAFAYRSATEQTLQTTQ
ncbi:hypothetical protein HDU84_008864 [Entophlyctis sp. JEL0112]|nr:hypothetical protein HDU84_008864 [Entophlyctis sp. JEL0112]